MAIVHGYVVVDTAIFSYLVRRSPLAHGNDALIGKRRLVLSFQTIAELLSAKFSISQRGHLNRALATAVLLPHQFETSRRYAEVANVRKALVSAGRAGRDAGDADMWIIAGGLEHRLPLITHDKQMLALARLAHCQVWTLLPGERDANP